MSDSCRPSPFRKRGEKAPIWLQKAASIKLATVNSPSSQVQEDERSLSMCMMDASRLNPRSPPDAGGYGHYHQSHELLGEAEGGHGRLKRLHEPVGDEGRGDAGHRQQADSHWQRPQLLDGRLLHLGARPRPSSQREWYAGREHHE